MSVSRVSQIAVSRCSQVLVSQQPHRFAAVEYGYTLRDGRVSSLSLDYDRIMRQMRAHWPDLIDDVSQAQIPRYETEETPVRHRARRRILA